MEVLRKILAVVDKCAHRKIEVINGRHFEIEIDIQLENRKSRFRENNGTTVLIQIGNLDKIISKRGYDSLDN